jgi:phosphoglycolate phosphatase
MITASFLSEPVTRVVWDWNGTLLDDAWLCVAAMNEVLQRYAMPPMSVERYQQIFDFPVIRYYERLGFDFERAPFERVGLEFIEAYQRRRLECQLQAGAREALVALRAAGVPQTILSAHEHATLQTLLAHFELAEYFEQVTGLADHYAAGKLEQGMQWVEQVAHPPRQILLVGDTLHDAEVAAAMGVQCVLVDAGNQHVDRLRAAGVPVFASLPALLEAGLLPG